MADTLLVKDRESRGGKDASTHAEKKYPRSDSDHGNVSVPLEAVDFMDKFIGTEEASRTDIKSRRDLAIMLYEIMLAKIANMDADIKRHGPWKVSNITISRELSDELDDVAGSLYITKALWLPFKTSLLAFALHHLMMEQDKQYKELVEKLKVSMNDIREYKREKKRQAGRSSGQPTNA